METCAISIQFCWSHFKRSWTCNSINIHIMVEGTTMAYTGVIQLACNRGQYSHRTLGKEKGACCISTTSRRHHTKILKTEQTHQSYCILQKSSTTADILRPTGNQLHEGYDMLQSSSLMARVQDLLATEGCDWRFIPLRWPRFRWLGSSSNIHDVPPDENTLFSHCYLRKKLHITCWDTGLSKFQTLMRLIQWSSQPNTFVSRTS